MMTTTSRFASSFSKVSALSRVLQGSVAPKDFTSVTKPDAFATNRFICVPTQTDIRGVMVRIR